MKEDCIFCKLANDIIPTNSIYEDEEFKVILDASPATKGHALILPKSHFADIYELPEETCGRVMRLAKRLAVDITYKLGADGFNLVQNNKAIAGQTVFHFHLHLIPRYADDGQVIGWKPREVEGEELRKIAEILKK